MCTQPHLAMPPLITASIVCNQQCAHPPTGASIMRKTLDAWRCGGGSTACRAAAVAALLAAAAACRPAALGCVAGCAAPAAGAAAAALRGLGSCGAGGNESATSCCRCCSCCRAICCPCSSSSLSSSSSCCPGGTARSSACSREREVARGGHPGPATRPPPALGCRSSRHGRSPAGPLPRAAAAAAASLAVCCATAHNAGCVRLCGAGLAVAAASGWGAAAEAARSRRCCKAAWLACGCLPRLVQCAAGP